VREVIDVTCACGENRFGLGIDDDAGAAIRLCLTCRSEVVMLESDSVLDDADLYEATCGCGHTVFHVAVGFSFTGDDEVRWVSVGLDCTLCHVAGVYVDWKVDYSPSRQLLAAV
jgi:hypothetical protein